MDRMSGRLRALLATMLLGAMSASSLAGTIGDEETLRRFEFLGTHGNSNCSAKFLADIPNMTPVARLQGSCCSPMSLHRYGEQVAALGKFATISIIPPDPYDVNAGLAQELLAAYDLPLTAEQQAAYDYAMANSDEKGPCCCRCWRWNVFGGLGKLLLRDHGFTGEQLVEVWDLSNGCGGDEEHNHG
jgi:hypothetical protein